MSRQRLALVVAASLGLGRLACGPPPNGWDGAGRQYVLPTPAPSGDGGSDGGDSASPPDTSLPVDTGTTG